MRASWLKVSLIALLCGVVAAPAASEPAARARQDVALVDVVDQLRSRGLPVIYSSRLLPRHLRVPAPPESGEPEQVLASLLAPHGLILRGEGRYLVIVRASEPADAPPDAAASVAPAAIEEVVVSASRYALEREADLFRVNAQQDDIFALPDVGDDALKYLQRLPGTAANGVSARTHVRGGVQDEVDIVLNGHRLRDPFHVRDFQSPFSVIDSRAVGSMQVYSGAFPARYGERMSGLVIIDSLRPEVPLRHELGLSVYSTSALSSGYFDDGRGHWLASARRGNLDLFIDERFGSPRYADAFAVVAYDVNERLSIAVNTLLADDAVDVFVEDSVDELVRSRDDVRSRQLWLNADVTLSDRWAATSVLSYESSRRDRLGRNLQDDKIDASVRDFRDLTAWSARTDVQFEASEATHWRFGAGYERARSRYRYDASGVYGEDWLAWQTIDPRALARDIDAAVRGEVLFAYASVLFSAGPSSTAEIGVRWDKQTYTDVDDNTSWSPRLSLMRQLGSDWELRASFGRYYQAQRLDELDIADGDTRFYPAQRTDQYIVGLRRQLGGALSARVELYHKYANRLAPRYENLLDPTQVTPELAPDRRRIAPEAARAWGAEVLVEHRDEDLTWWLSAAYARAEDRLPGVGWAPRSWDQRRSVNLGLQRQVGPWTLSASYSWRSGWPTTPVRLDTGTGRASLELADYNRDRLGGFSSLNMRAQRRVQVPIGELDLFVEVSNAANARNPCCRDYDVERNEDEVPFLDISEDNWLGVFPAAGILWRF
ncbi:MAG: TonB-dependent receptor [Pseudomonadota bacterium]